MPTQPANVEWDDERVTDREDTVGVGTYDEYTQSHQYATDTGLVALPLASRTADFRLIRLHGGMQMRTVDWTATRNGKPPVIPSQKDTEFDKFMGGTVTVALPIPNKEAAGYNWAVSGSYIFLEASPRIVGTDTLPTGQYPYPVEPNDTLANAAYAANSGEINAGMSELAEAGENVDPSSPADVVGEAVDEDVDHSTDAYRWPFTLLPPIFTTDAAIDT